MDFDDPRLPNGICANCRQALQNSSKSYLLPEPQDYTKFTVQCPSPSSPHNEATCLVCKLGRMDIVAARKLASMAAARKIGSDMELCTNCLDYKSEGVTHDCELSQLPQDSSVEKPSTSQVMPAQSEAKTGLYLVQALSVTVTVHGNQKRCQCKQLSLYPMIFSIRRRSFFGPEMCHDSRIVTLTGVTVTDRAWIYNNI